MRRIHTLFFRFLQMVLETKLDLPLTLMAFSGELKMEATNLTVLIWVATFTMEIQGRSLIDSMDQSEGTTDIPIVSARTSLKAMTPEHNLHGLISWRMGFMLTSGVKIPEM